MSLHDDIAALGRQAREASYKLAQLSTEAKNDILEGMAGELNASRAALQEANAKDLDAGRERGLSSAMLDRLELTDKRIDAMISGIREVKELPDPVGALLSEINRPNGLVIKKVRVPIGVIGIVYESRPNVTADATALCFKSANAVILRGGSEAIHSNKAIAAALQQGGERAGLPAHSVQLVQTTDREAVRELVQLEGFVDLVIPRGGEGLIRAVVEMARVPVLKHYLGICHVYVDESADLEKAIAICENAKVQRPGVCNAMETMLVHQAVAAEFLPKVSEMFTAQGVELRGDERARAVVSSMNEATEDDWRAEYLDLILAVRVVDGVQDAIAHINTYGSKHTDAIVAQSQDALSLFRESVDSSTVCTNASTRFSDGAIFGMGAEIGISTDKLHARGPMGLEELCIYKFVVEGDGQVRE